MLSSGDNDAASTSNVSLGRAELQLQEEDISVRRNDFKITSSQWLTVFFLCYVNLLMYMDRSILIRVQREILYHFEINYIEADWVHLLFILSFMISLPLFGYFGDRHSRKWIIIFGVSIWNFATFLGSFFPKNWFGMFLLSRALVGVGQASFSTVALTILGDMFVGDRRSKMIVLIVLTIPVGNMLGQFAGSLIAHTTGSWEWELRVTPVLGYIGVLLIIFYMMDPSRGESEGNTELKTTTYKEDLKDLAKNKSFILSSLGFTCAMMVTDALAWWGPKFIIEGRKIQENGDSNLDFSFVRLQLGVVRLVALVIGVPLGCIASQKLRVKYPKADPLICAFGLLASVPLMIMGVITAQYNTIACLVLIFFAALFLNLTWVIVADILLYVVIPTRRSSAEAFQLLLISLLGEALSTAATSDNHKDDPVEAFRSIYYFLIIVCFITVLGGVLFLLNARYIVGDKSKCNTSVVGASTNYS